jgi:gas vesicle protein GvpG
VFLLDSLLIGGLRFVLDKVATIADSELNDDTKLREHLLAMQMRLELGEITQADFDAFEADILVRLREIRARQMGDDGATVSSQDYKITGIDASFEGDEH